MLSCTLNGLWPSCLLDDGSLRAWRCCTCWRVIRIFCVLSHQLGGIGKCSDLRVPKFLWCVRWCDVQCAGGPGTSISQWQRRLQQTDEVTSAMNSVCPCVCCTGHNFRSPKRLQEPQRWLQEPQQWEAVQPSIRLTRYTGLLLKHST